MGLACQHQRTNLDGLLGCRDGLHVAAVVKVAMALWVHAYLRPVRVVEVLLSAGYGGRLVHGVPVALDGGDRALGFACCNAEGGLLRHAECGVCYASDALVPDAVTSSKASGLAVNCRDPHAVVAIGWDVKAQAHWVTSLEHARWRAVQVALVCRQGVDRVISGRWLRDKLVGLDGLVLLDQLLIFGASHLVALNLLCALLQLRHALGDVLEVHVDAVDHGLDAFNHALNCILHGLLDRAALGVVVGLLVPDVGPVLVRLRDATTSHGPLFEGLALLGNRIGFD